MFLLTRKIILSSYLFMIIHISYVFIKGSMLYQFFNIHFSLQSPLEKTNNNKTEHNQAHYGM